MGNYSDVAESFAQALVAGNFRAAHELLTPNLRASLSPQVLAENLRSMYVRYAPDDQPLSTSFDRELCLEDWPDKEQGDLGSVYVGILGSEFVEAVIVIVCESAEGSRIRQVDWGRP